MNYPWLANNAYPVRKLAHIARLKARIGWQNLRSEEFVEEGPYCVTGTDFKAGKIDWPKCYRVSNHRYETDANIQLRNGDLLVTKDGTIGKVAVVASMPGPATLNSGVFLLRPTGEGLHTPFMQWVIQSQVFNDFVKLTSNGSTIIHLYQNTFEKFRLPYPDLETQKLVAEFLSRETDRIDQLIEKRSCFVALLNEKKTAVVSHAVTQGINSRVEYKKSGVRWLGEVPAHWQIVPPTALFTESKERAKNGDELLSSTQKYGVIPLSKYEELEQRQVTLAITNLEKRKHVEVGDFVISMRSMDGGLERAHARGCVRSSYSVLKAGPNVYGRFYGYLLKSKLYIQAIRQTANFIRDGQDMNFSHFRRVPLPRFDISEQKSISDHIGTELSKIDALVSKVARSVDILRQHRSALITAAVTGQIDVSNEPSAFREATEELAS